MDHDSPPPRERALVIEESMCCGYKRCPSVQVFDDGSVRTEDEGRVIEYTPEQADRLEALLRLRQKGQR